MVVAEIRASRAHHRGATIKRRLKVGTNTHRTHKRQHRANSKRHRLNTIVGVMAITTTALRASKAMYLTMIKSHSEVAP